MKKLLFPVIVLTLILLMAVAVSASAEEIWTIGYDDDSRNEFWTTAQPDSPSEILYIVGTTDILDFPGFLHIAEVEGPSYVDIEFTTTESYAPVILLYDRMGGETDEVRLDGDLLGTCAGPSDPYPSTEYIFNIGEILPDTYILTIECVSGGDGRHWIDWLQLRTVEPTVTTSRSGPDEVDVGEEASWTITIQICGDDKVDLNNVVVQGGIGADLVVITTEGTDFTLTKKGKGKMGATIVKWDIETLVSGECLTLNLVVETGLNPKGKQEFTSAELGHELDGGFSATYWYDEMEYKTSETPPLTVDVVE